MPVAPSPYCQLYEAIVPGMDGYRSLLPIMPAAGRNEAYDWSLVANAALAEILRSLFPTAPAAEQSALVALAPLIFA